MATISACHSLSSIRRATYQAISSPSCSCSSSLGRPVLMLHYPSLGLAASFKRLTVGKLSGKKKIRSVAEETVVPEEQSGEGGEEEVTPADQLVSVPVSPSDKLIMFFQAEGTINETAIPTVTKALEEADGVGNIKVQLLEGIGSVELTKQTTIQATGVASSLIEIIQGSGFKLQTLNLSFEDEEYIIV